jgi:hypothetical protein
MMSAKDTTGMPRKRDALPFLSWPRPNLQLGRARGDLRVYLFFGIMLILIGLAGWLYLRQASEVASYAHEIRQLEREQERLHREITALRAEVALAGSLDRALALGAQAGYSLPDAGDTVRRMRVVYQPAPLSNATVPLAQPSGSLSDDTVGDQFPGPAFLRRWFAQLKAWIEAPPGAGVAP